MGIALKYQHHRIGNKRKTKPKLFIRWLYQCLCCVLVFFVVGYCIIWCLEPTHFPITTVSFTGVRSHLSQEELRKVVLPEIKVGFFRLKVSTLQKHMLALPWMRQVDIRKVWPDKLIVRFEEHTPAAYWGKCEMISDRGVLFSPVCSKVKLDHLPLLQGPQGKSSIVWEQYLVMEKTLTRINLHITDLMLAPRGAWHLRLSNGVRVVLGTNDILQRLERFVRVYENHLYRQNQEISYVDMRYTSGMAVGWKT